MTKIELIVRGAEVRAVVRGLLTSGMVGIPVSIRYDDAWNGLTKNLICTSNLRYGPFNGKARTITNIDTAAIVAHEVMQADKYLYLGIEGRSADGKLVMPTKWVECGKIHPGANADADPSAEPTLPVWAQLQAQIDSIKQHMTDDSSSQGKNCLLSVETITIPEAPESETVAVTGVALDYSSLSLTVGDTVQLAASVTPGNATNTVIVWETSDDGIAAVHNGLVTAISDGSAAITARSAENSAIAATCAVTVAAADSGETTGKIMLSSLTPVNSSAVLKRDAKTEFTIGDASYYLLPYSDGMEISTPMNSGWVTNYPPVIVVDGGSVSIPSAAKGDAVQNSAIVYTCTVAGYSESALVYVNTYYLSTNGEYGYYIPGGAE